MVSIRTNKVLGTLKRLIISHDNKGTSPGWYVDKVVVTRSEGSNKSVHVLVNHSKNV